MACRNEVENRRESESTRTRTGKVPANGSVLLSRRVSYNPCLQMELALCTNILPVFFFLYEIDNEVLHRPLTTGLLPDFT